MDASAKQQVLQQAKAEDVKFIRMWFTDMLGTLKSFALTVEELEDALDGGLGFDGSSITGYNDIEESDMIAMPDPTTFNLLPWRPEDGAGVARMFADVQTPEGRPYEGDPRHVLRRAEQRALESVDALATGEGQAQHVDAVGDRRVDGAHDVGGRAAVVGRVGRTPAGLVGRDPTADAEYDTRPLPVRGNGRRGVVTIGHRTGVVTRWS